MNKPLERFNDIMILQLNTDGFDNLTEQQKQLSFHLSNAGLWGRFISVQQGSALNVPLFNNLITLYENTPSDSKLNKELHDSLYILFAHNGIYHSTSGELLTIPLTQNSLMEYKDIEPELVSQINKIWFETKIPQFRTIQTAKPGVDVISESGGNFYENLTKEEVSEFRKKNYPQIENDEVPPYGFNERLVKGSDGVISRQVINQDDLYSTYVQKIIENLTLALPYAENQEQEKSISTLIDFYRTGTAEDFDTHCIAWTNDRNSSVYFINGMIESYEDPIGIASTFESIVGFKDTVKTKKVGKIIDNIQWIENNLPFDKQFKKDKAVGLSASYVNVVSTAGETAPSLPLGINLPNSDWIRKKHGSKSVNLANVAAGRSTVEEQLREVLYLKEYHPIMEKYGTITSDLHTDLHEIAGHGSGITKDGVNSESLGTFYSTIEESRADLVALYFLANDKLKEFGIFDKDVNVHDAAKAQYVSYLTNGAFAQLRRVELGNDLTQAHFRNRQLISNWILAHADTDKVKLTKHNGEHFIEVNDIYHLQEMFGKLLSKVQTIKSTGDLKGAEELVMNYGTKVNQELHSELLERMSKLDLPKVTAFTTPILVQTENSIVIEQSNDFFKQQMNLYKEFFIPENTLQNQKKLKIR